MKSTNLGELVQSCDFKILYIMINDKKIEQNYINDMSIDWNGTFRIYGYCTINDHFDLVNTMLLNPGQELTIHYIDNYEDKFERTFVITQSHEIKEQNFKSVTLTFQDNISFKLQNTFKAKSYTNTNIVDVFKEYIKSEVSDDIKNVTITDGKFKTLKRTNFVVPLHIDFLTFMEIEFAKDAIWLYQTKENIIIGNVEIPETPDYKYKQVGGKDLYGFKIIEYNLDFNNIKETNTKPKANVLVYDKNTKSIVDYSKNLEDYLPDWTTEGTSINSQLTNGNKLETKEYLLDTSKFDLNTYKYNTKIEIIVPGNIGYSILYKNVDVLLSGAVYTKETRETGDVKLTGKYQISRVEDKFLIGHKFVQRLTLRRVFEGTSCV